MKINNRIINYLLFFAIIILTSFSHNQKLDLLSLKDWNIIVAQNAITSEKFAAEEFQSLFEKASGIKLPIINNPLSSEKNVFIGYSDFIKSSDCRIEINDLDKEGLRINIKTDNIAIAGGRPRGTLYGVYEFAERYMGIRFLTYDYTYVPFLIDDTKDKKEKVLNAFPDVRSSLIPCEEYTYKPCFVYRSTYYKENFNHPEFSVRLRNNTFAKEDKYGGNCDMQFIVHSFYRQCPVEKYGKEHPEYFAEVGGKRLLDSYGGGPQIDVSNPEVIKVMTNSVIKEIAEHPEFKNVSVVQNDNQYYCMCKNCEAINQKEGTPMGAHLAMVNAIADEVKKVYPDVKVGTLAYQYTRKPPLTIKPHDNVMIQLCSIECDLLHSYAEQGNEMNMPFAEDLANWGKICNNLWIWDYIVDFGNYCMPFPNLRSISKNLKYYKDNNVKGVFLEADYTSASGDMSDLRNYIASRCMWNPELDSWELTKEFCNLYYKKAAKPIIEYLTALHDNADDKHLMARFNASPSDVGLDADFSEWAFDKFDEALKMADDNIVRSRVERASICAYVAMIETAKGEPKFINGKVNYQSSKKYKFILKTFPELARKYDMKYYSEDEDCKMEKIEKGFNNELKVYANGGRPAVQLSNSNWRLTVLTEENAKCLELTYKPTLVNLLSADRNNLSGGAFSESFIKGNDIKDTMKFEVRSSEFGVNNKHSNQLVLLSKLKDGTEYKRILTLSEDGTGKIICQSTIANKSDKENIYQLKSELNILTGLRDRDAKILNASVKYDGKLAQFNKGLIGSHGPDEHLLGDAKDGGMCLLFNLKNKTGFVETYNPKDIEALDGSWNDMGSNFSLGFKTKEFKLKPGESYTFSYDFKYLNQLPAY